MECCGTNPLYFATYMSDALVRLHANVARARRIEFGEPGALVQIDGELVGETPATINIVLDALTLLCPRTLSADTKTKVCGTLERICD